MIFAWTRLRWGFADSSFSGYGRGLVFMELLRSSGNFWSKLFHSLKLRLFPRQNMSYNGHCLLVLSNIVLFVFFILQFLQWLKEYLNFSVLNFYVTCNICISAQVLRALDDRHNCLHIGSGKDKETLIPFTVVSKDDCTCLNANISKQSSFLLMP